MRKDFSHSEPIFPTVPCLIESVGEPQNLAYFLAIFKILGNPGCPVLDCMEMQFSRIKFPASGQKTILGCSNKKGHPKNQATLIAVILQ